MSSLGSWSSFRPPDMSIPPPPSHPYAGQHGFSMPLPAQAQSTSTPPSGGPSYPTTQQTLNPPLYNRPSYIYYPSPNLTPQSQQHPAYYQYHYAQPPPSGPYYPSQQPLQNSNASSPPASQQPNTRKRRAQTSSNSRSKKRRTDENEPHDGRPSLSFAGTGIETEIHYETATSSAMDVWITRNTSKEPKSLVASHIRFFTQGIPAPPPQSRPEDSRTDDERKVRPKEGDRLACRLCSQNQYRHWQNASSSSRRIMEHLKRAHQNEWVQRCRDYDLKYSDKLGNDGSLPTSSEHLRTYRPDEFTIDGLQQRLVRLFTVADLSLNLIDRYEFRDLLLYASASDNTLADKDVPHRKKLTDLIYDAFHKEHGRIVRDLEGAIGRIAFTSDMWTRGIPQGYMAITAHFLAWDGGNLTLQSRLVAFRHVPGSHDGKTMARVFVHVLDELKVAHRVSTITLDNAANNGTMMVEIGVILRARGIEFDEVMNRIRCFPHIINLSVKAGLDYVTHVDRADDGLDGYDLDSDARLEPNWLLDADYKYELERDVIGKVRKLVNACRASGQRREGLSDTIRQGNAEGWWEDEKGKKKTLAVLELLRDVDTRWSSIYYMVTRLLDLYPAVERFIKDKNDFEMESHLLDGLQRRILKDICIFLYVFHVIQEIASAEKTPTLTLVLPLFESLRTNLDSLAKSFPNLDHVIQASKAKLQDYINTATWIEQNMSASDAQRTKSEIKEAMLRCRRTMTVQPNLHHAPYASSAPSTAASAQAAGLSKLEALSKTLSSGSLDTTSSAAPEHHSSPADNETEPSTEDVYKAEVEEEYNRWVSNGVYTGRAARDYEPLQSWRVSLSFSPVKYH